MVSSAQWCIGLSVGLAKLSQLSNGGSRLTDTECGKQCSVVYWLECWPYKAESAQQWRLEAD